MADKKIGLVVTHAADDPEMATLPFIIANGALVMNVEPVIILQGEGVRLAVRGGADAVRAEGLAPLGDLMDAVLGSELRIMVCSPCLATRGIAESDLRDGCYVGGAGVIVQAMLDCENFLRY
ncbi:MAG TPA: DsrE family protein [Coriobacteriia bacterium]